MEFLGGVFVFLTLVFLLLAFIGLIHPKLIKQENRKLVLQRFLLPVPIFFVFAGILLPEPPTDSNNTVDVKKTTTEEQKIEFDKKSQEETASKEQGAKEKEELVKKAKAEQEAQEEKENDENKQNKSWKEKIASKPKVDVLEMMKTSLKPWQPQSTELSSGILSIVLPQDRITDDIFRAVIMSGICGSLFSSGKRWEGVKEVQVINRHNRQGYIFEGGEHECVEIADMGNKAAVNYIFGKARLF